MPNENTPSRSELNSIRPQKIVVSLLTIAIGSIIIFFICSQVVALKITLTIIVTYIGLILWITEIIPFALSSLLVLILYVFTNVATIESILSGFASGAVFLIMGGMMIAKGVNNTPFGQRIVYYFLKLLSKNYRTLLLGIIFIPQILAIFIPATGVRTALILPIIISLISVLNLEKYEHTKKQMMLAVAYAGNISGIGFLPAAIGNVLVVEILYIYTDITISYFDWLLYTFPIWLLTIPITWYVVATAFPTEKIELRNVRQVLEEKLKSLGPIRPREKRCIIILIITVGLWATQSIHGFHPAIPALFSVILLGLPYIGVVHWKELKEIDLNTFLLVGATLSIGRILVDTGTIDFLASILFTENFLNILIQPLIVILFVVILVQIFHLAISNVSTAVVTIIPVVISLANELDLNPVMLAIAAGIACLLGFILVVETIPNVLAYSTGYLKQKDFFRPGIHLTIYTTIVIFAVAATWWKFLGLY